MCVSQQGRVLAVEDGMALVSIGDLVREVPLTVVASQGIDVAPGDFLLIHTGLAVAVISPHEAAQRSSFLSQGAAHEDP